MRVLVPLRGAPGCGKSTWIAQNNETGQGEEENR